MEYPSSEYYNEHVMAYYRNNLKTKSIFGGVKK